MKYIEIIVLVNGYIHVLMVLYTSLILRTKVKLFMIFISTIIDLAYVIFYLLFPYVLEPYRYLIIITITATSFIGCKKFLLGVVFYLLLNFCLGGTSLAVNKVINSFYVVVGILVVLTFIYILLKLISGRLDVDIKNQYDIVIRFNRKKYKMVGFCDTGNSLIYKNRPVIFLSYSYNIGLPIGYASVKSISGESRLLIYSIDELLIRIKGKYVIKRCYIAYSNISVDVMFGSSLLGG